MKRLSIPYVRIGCVTALSCCLGCSTGPTTYQTSTGISGSTANGLRVVQVPGHWYYGYWVPEQYTVYPGVGMPNGNYIWQGEVFGPPAPWRGGPR